MLQNCAMILVYFSTFIQEGMQMMTPVLFAEVWLAIFAITLYCGSHYIRNPYLAMKMQTAAAAIAMFMILAFIFIRVFIIASLS